MPTRWDVMRQTEQIARGQNRHPACGGGGGRGGARIGGGETLARNLCGVIDDDLSAAGESEEKEKMKKMPRGKKLFDVKYT